MNMFSKITSTTPWFCVLSGKKVFLIILKLSSQKFINFPHWLKRRKPKPITITNNHDIDNQKGCSTGGGGGVVNLKENIHPSLGFSAKLGNRYAKISHFSRIFFLPKIFNFFFIWVGKNAKVFAFFATIRFNLLREKKKMSRKNKNANILQENCKNSSEFSSILQNLFSLETMHFLCLK